MAAAGLLPESSGPADVRMVVARWQAAGGEQRLRSCTTRGLCSQPVQGLWTRDELGVGAV